MSVTLTLARPDDADRLLALMAARTSADPRDPERLRADLAPLLDGTPHGVAYLIGPPRAPVGYAILSFGYSLLRGGLEARIEDIYIRAAVRGRGMGSEAVSALAAALAPHGVTALHIEVGDDDPGTASLARRAGFRDLARSRRATRKM